ncbi:MAG: protein phosphatase 2C domain-containing protein, partial [Deltaproteobacteria bacterium]|nr:protein phosphatase 2C domain-containing protein [Deltaproteobacteria bacterium]
IFRVDRIRKELNRKTYQFPSQAIWLRGARVGPESRALTVPLRNMPPVEAVAPESIPPELTPTNEIVVPLEQEMPLRWMIPPGAPLLRPNYPLLGSVPNLPTAPRNVVHQAFIPHVGETAAFTDVGLCKKHLKNSKLPPVNEDAFGIGTDHQGNPVFVVADGLGGHGRGDEASKIMVENLLENLSKKPLTLAEGFLAAHEKISQFNLAQSEADKAAATVGGAVRINPDGTFEVALVGDIRFWILRPQLDGSFKILEPYYPDYRAGAMRELGKFKTTLEMHSSQVPGSNDVSSCLGAPETVFDVVEVRSPGRNDQILNTAVTLSSEEGSQPQRELFKAQQGDGFILMSDGVATLFDEAQLAETIRGLNTAQDIQKALQQETKKRLNLYLNGAYGVLNDKRVLLEDGRYIDRRGNIFASASLQDRQVLAHVGPDNTTALVFIYNPQLQEQLPETPPLREAAKSIVPGEPLVHLDSPTTFKIPEVHVSYEGQTQKLIFNPAHPRLMFGTEFQPTLFPPKNKWLSRQHFSVEIAKVNQQWGYNIRVSSRYGLLVDGYQAPQNHTLFFAPESQCEIRSVKALDVDGKPIWDNPIVLQLPKIETILPSWMDPPLKD